MDAERIVADLEAERDRLDTAIAALKGSGQRGRKPGRGRRRLSPAAKKRISDAMKRTWAARKRAAHAA